MIIIFPGKDRKTKLQGEPEKETDYFSDNKT